MIDYKLEEILRKALKDYTHFAEVVVRTNPSGTIEIEELSNNLNNEDYSLNNMLGGTR